MMIRASLLVLAAVAALAVSGNVVAKPSRKRKTHLESSGDEDANRRSRRVEEKEENQTAGANRQGENPNGTDEAERVKLLLNELRRREIAVGNKLLELYGLREQRSFVEHLKKQLRVRSSEAEKSDLEKEIRESSAREKQREAAEETVKQWQKKVNAGEIQMKAQLNTIEERVYGFRGKEKSSREPPAFDRKKMKAMEDVKLKVLEMNRRNKELELEKRELALKLGSAQAKTSSLSTTTESEAIAGIKEEASSLRRGNEGLLKQMETLQKRRFGMVEELVYQKWLNSCLRFEVQGYRKTPARAPGRDPGEDWGSGSRREAKPAAARPASDRPDSPWTATESREIRSGISKRSSLIAKIKRWNRGERDVTADASPERSRPSKRFPARAGLICRFSTSMVPESPGPEIRPRRRRVSFDDRIGVRNLEPEFGDTLPPAPNEMEPFSRADGAASVVQQDKARKHRDVTGPEATSSSHQSTDGSEQNETDERAAGEIGPARSPEAGYGQTNRVEARSPSLVSASSIIFIFILLLMPRFCS